MNSQQISRIGETAVMLELLKMGYDVINLNSSYSNYPKADLICINPDNGKSTMIQVKTGTTKNILVGFTSEDDGSIKDIEKKINGPWIFVKTDKEKASEYEFYILTKEEILELITTSNKWYVTQWNRRLNSNPIIGVDIAWLEGKNVEASPSHYKIQHPEYKNPLNGITTKDCWNKIVNLLK